MVSLKEEAVRYILNNMQSNCSYEGVTKVRVSTALFLKNTRTIDCFI